MRGNKGSLDILHDAFAWYENIQHTSLANDLFSSINENDKLCDKQGTIILVQKHMHPQHIKQHTNHTTRIRRFYLLRRPISENENIIVSYQLPLNKTD